MGLGLGWLGCRGLSFFWGGLLLAFVFFCFFWLGGGGGEGWYFEFEAVEEPDAVNEDFVFLWEVGGLGEVGGGVAGVEEVFEEVVEYGVLVVVWGWA